MRRTRFARLPALLLAALTGLACIPTAAESQSDDWEVLLAPYVFFAGISGDVGIGRIDSQPVNVGFGDILENLQAGFMFHGEVRKGDWGLLADLLYVGLGSELSGPVGGVADVDVDQLVLETFLTRRVGEWADLYAGIRSWNIDIDLELDGLVGGSLGRGDNWIDPAAGARLMPRLSEDWFLILRGEVGGFGVGSDFSWVAQGGVGWDVSNSFSLVAQYRALGVNRESGEIDTAEHFLYDTVTHGPVLGFLFRP